MFTKNLLSVIFSMLLVSATQAQQARRLTLDGKDDAHALVETGDGHIHQVPTPELEIYQATTKAPAHGTIMVSVGGGYGALAIVKEGRNVAKLLNEAGWDVALLLYPVSAGPGTRQMALDAAEKALALLQKRGGEFGLSTIKIGAMGFSAGGHLTARVAHESAASSAPPAFLILMYPAYLEKDGKILDDVTPINVPTFLYVGDKDKMFLPSSEAYAAACKEKGIRCDFTVAPNVGHGFGLTDHLPPGAKDWPDKLKAFLASLDSKG